MHYMLYRYLKLYCRTRLCSLAWYRHSAGCKIW